MKCNVKKKLKLAIFHFVWLNLNLREFEKLEKKNKQNFHGGKISSGRTQRWGKKRWKIIAFLIWYLLNHIIKHGSFLWKKWGCLLLWHVDLWWNNIQRCSHFFIACLTSTEVLIELYLFSNIFPKTPKLKLVKIRWKFLSSNRVEIREREREKKGKNICLTTQEQVHKFMADFHDLEVKMNYEKL